MSASTRLEPIACHPPSVDAANPQALEISSKSHHGMLIINADDWGGWKSATDATLSCYTNGRITSVSAMVFMEDSERAARIANELGMDVGLHVNFDQEFSGPGCPPVLRQAHDRIRRFLKRSKHALLLYHPFLRMQFRRVYDLQAHEFCRLYGRSPSHIDGHRHLHLCSNMLFDKILPEGQNVRRSFTFRRGEKSFLNRAYRRFVDKRLAHRHRTTDYFFALSQYLKNERFIRVEELAKRFTVELMTHPERSDEYHWLMSDECLRMFDHLQLRSYSHL